MVIYDTFGMALNINYDLHIIFKQFITISMTKIIWPF